MNNQLVTPAKPRLLKIAGGCEVIANVEYVDHQIILDTPMLVETIMVDGNPVVSLKIWMAHSTTQKFPIHSDQVVIDTEALESIENAYINYRKGNIVSEPKEETPKDLFPTIATIPNRILH